MSRIPHPGTSTSLRFALTILAVAGLALAQDQTPPTPPQSTPPPSGGWRRVGDPPPAPAQDQAPLPSTQPQAQDPSQPTDRSDAYGQQLPPATGDPQDAQQPPQQGAPPPPQQMGPQGNPPAYGLPAQVTLPAGTYVTARTNQPLSSDHNLVGDSFSATLVQPVVVNGIVVAQRGQTVYGRVTEAQKAHSDKPSRLGLELTGITLADGTQLPVRSQLVNRQGGSTPGGIQAGTVVGTTAVGAAIGGAVGWGTGAAIGAGAGALAGIAGVLMTRNHPTIIYPETALMFQVSAPVTIATSSQAFHYVGPNEYGPGVQMQMQPARPPVPGYSSNYGPGPYGGYAPYGAYAPYPYYPYPYPYYYPYYPYWGGVGFYFGGPRGFFGGRGFRR
ncbi:MAG TPA: hypothetical protein VME43_02245 [Bryobacteraceae bacterium]|nr:hypothetical protein [Bryobacteraceae bacterium]